MLRENMNIINTTTGTIIQNKEGKNCWFIKNQPNNQYSLHKNLDFNGNAYILIPKVSLENCYFRNVEDAINFIVIITN